MGRYWKISGYHRKTWEHDPSKHGSDPACKAVKAKDVDQSILRGSPAILRSPPIYSIAIWEEHDQGQ